MNYKIYCHNGIPERIVRNKVANDRTDVPMVLIKITVDRLYIK